MDPCASARDVQLNDPIYRTPSFRHILLPLFLVSFKVVPRLTLEVCGELVFCQRRHLSYDGMCGRAARKLGVSYAAQH